MAERGIGISYESIRLWCIKFGPKYAKRLRRRHQGYGDRFFIDEVFVKIQGKHHYLSIQSGAAFDIGQTLSIFPSAKPALGVQRAFASWKWVAAT